MKMTLPKFLSYFTPFLLASCVLSGQAQQPAAQPLPVAPPVSAEAQLTSPQLQSLVASIALYPDALLAQMLMASTYPLEVATAASWLRQSKLSGDALDAALSEQQWDNSVKSLVHFPDALNLMGNQLEWTRKLGDAYLAQPAELMSAVQALRNQAKLNGNLTSGPQVLVSTDAQTNIVIVPANPQIIYVPAYNPWVVYGPWPYVAYPPYPMFNPGWGVVAFGVGFGVGYSLWAYPYWGRGGVYINNGYYNRFNTRYNIAAYRYPARAGAQSAWAFNPAHRLNVPYGAPGVQQRYGANAIQQQRTNQSRQAAQNTFHQAMPTQHAASAAHAQHPGAAGNYARSAGAQRSNHSGRTEHR